MTGLRYYLILVIAIILMIGGYVIAGWRSDAKKLPNVTAQLKAEKDCLEGSTCATRAIESAKQAAEQVAKAQEEAARQNKDAEDRAKAQADKYAAEIAKATQQHQAELSKILSHQNSPSCQEQRKVKIVCALN